MNRRQLLLWILPIAALALSARPPTSSATPAAAGGLPDGDYLFFDLDGILPEVELLAAFSSEANPDARVTALSADPERFCARLLGGDAELVRRIRTLDGVPFAPLDPRAPSILERLDIRQLPAIVIVRGGVAHVREGAAAVDLRALAGCDPSGRRKP